MTITTLAGIEELTKYYAEARQVLSERVAALEDEMLAAKRRKIHGIKTAKDHAASAHELLRNAIEATPALFTKPRTVLFHGIRVGLTKGKGVMSWSDDAKLCERIEKLFPEDAAALIKTTVKPLKTGLAQRPAADLKRLGVTVTDTGDQVVIRTTDSQLEKMVDALLKDAIDQAGQEYAA